MKFPFPLKPQLQREKALLLFKILCQNQDLLSHVLT